MQQAASLTQSLHPFLRKSSDPQHLFQESRITLEADTRISIGMPIELQYRYVRGWYVPTNIDGKEYFLPQNSIVLE